ANVVMINPSGAATELNQSLVTDTPDVDAGANIFSDTRNIEAPLPRLKIGAVVEEEVITKDRQAVLDAGGVETAWIGAYQPVLSTRIALSAPVKRKATVVT